MKSNDAQLCGVNILDRSKNKLKLSIAGTSFITHAHANGRSSDVMKKIEMIIK